MCPEVFGELSVACEEGLILAIGGGPTCGTWSRSRYVKYSPGPLPVRRRGRFAWGLPGLSPTSQQRVREANLLLLNFLYLCEAVVTLGGSGWLEHPKDPLEEPLPSIWATELILAWEERLGCQRRILDQ